MGSKWIEEDRSNGDKRIRESRGLARLCCGGRWTVGGEGDVAAAPGRDDPCGLHAEVPPSRQDNPVIWWLSPAPPSENTIVCHRQGKPPLLPPCRDLSGWCGRRRQSYPRSFRRNFAFPDDLTSVICWGGLVIGREWGKILANFSPRKYGDWGGVQKGNVSSDIRLVEWWK